jgi:glycerol-3-phosphate dehydrogenase
MLRNRNLRAKGKNVATNETRALTVRLSVEQAEDIETIAQVDGTSIAEEIRAALASHIAARRADADFAKRLRQTVERNQRALERLSE